MRKVFVIIVCVGVFFLSSCGKKQEQQNYNFYLPNEVNGVLSIDNLNISTEIKKHEDNIELLMCDEDNISTVFTIFEDRVKMCCEEFSIEILRDSMPEVSPLYDIYNLFMFIDESERIVKNDDGIIYIDLICNENEYHICVNGDSTTINTERIKLELRASLNDE